MPHVYWAEMPLVSNMGKYDLDKVNVRNERKKDFKKYLEQVVALHAQWIENCMKFSLDLANNTWFEFNQKVCLMSCFCI